MKPRLVRLLHENWVAPTSFCRIPLPEVLFPNITKTNIPRCHSEAQLLNKERKKEKKLQIGVQTAVNLLYHCLLCCRDPVDICGNQPTAVKLLSLTECASGPCTCLPLWWSYLVSPVAPTLRHVGCCTQSWRSSPHRADCFTSRHHTRDKRAWIASKFVP